MTSFMRYPYAVILELKEQDGDIYGDWLVENATGLWLRTIDDMFNFTDNFYFMNEVDAMLFVLKWGNVK